MPQVEVTCLWTSLTSQGEFLFRLPPPMETRTVDIEEGLKLHDILAKARRCLQVVMTEKVISMIKAVRIFPDLSIKMSFYEKVKLIAFLHLRYKVGKGEVGVDVNNLDALGKPNFSGYYPDGEEKKEVGDGESNSRQSSDSKETLPTTISTSIKVLNVSDVHAGHAKNPAPVILLI